MRRRLPLLACLLASALVVTSGTPAVAQAADAARGFLIAEGALSLEAPEGWKRVQPKSGIVETEFSIPAADAAVQPGRMTVMGAGGSVQANIDRWYGQFTQPDGGSTKDKSTTKTVEIAGAKVTIVDVSGTYKDTPGGPFAGGKSIDRPGYRMLAAIVEVPEGGNYFLKFYGPAALVSANADGFRGMIEGMVPAGK